MSIRENSEGFDETKRNSTRIMEVEAQSVSEQISAILKQVQLKDVTHSGSCGSRFTDPLHTTNAEVKQKRRRKTLICVFFFYI